MTFKKTATAFIAICITAILWIALCSCDDLGAYEDTDEYYASFGDIVLINGTTREDDDYSVEDYFYNKESREDFLEGDDGAYSGIEYADYVYMAIPIENELEIDSVALFLRSKEDVTVYMNVYVTDKIPSEWKSVADLMEEIESEKNESETEGEDEGETEPKVYDDPDPETRIGEITVFIKGGQWDSFIMDFFNVNDKREHSIKLVDGQYLLFQIRNNSGVRVLDENEQHYVDPQTGRELQEAEITMTNLLIRALNVENNTETEGGDE